MKRVFITQIASSFCEGQRGPHDITLLVLDQKIPDSSIITFLGKVETAVRSGNKSTFGITGFQHK